MIDCNLKLGDKVRINIAKYYARNFTIPIVSKPMPREELAAESSGVFVARCKRRRIEYNEIFTITQLQYLFTCYVCKIVGKDDCGLFILGTELEPLSNIELLSMSLDDKN